MDFLLLGIGFFLTLLGVLGSFLPVLPGPIMGWLGLLTLHFSSAVPFSWRFLGPWLAVSIAIFILDYIIPAIGTKKFGGSKAGIIGTSIGLIVGLLAPIPFGIIIGPFAGAFIGEMIYQNNSRRAVKAAFGSLLGFLAGTFIKFVVAVIFVGLYLLRIWEYRQAFWEQL